MNSPARIALSVYYYPFNSSPSLLNLARDLSQTDDLVLNIDPRFMLTPNDPLYQYQQNCIAIDSKDDASTVGDGKTPPFARTHAAPFSCRLKKYLLALLSPRIRSELRVFNFYFRQLQPFIKGVKSLESERYVIAADKSSLLPLFLAGRIPQCYYSLEATPILQERSLIGLFFGIIERVYLIFFRPFVICQSVERARLIGAPLKRVELLPVTCSGTSLPRSKRLKEMYNISDETTLVVYAGGMSPEFMVVDIIGSVDSWPHNFQLLLHSSNCNYPTDVLDAVKKSSRPIILSSLELTAVEANELIYAGADIGIVLYKGANSNLRQTVFSSGKLAALMRTGTPVLLPDFTEYDALLTRFRVGLKTRVSQLACNLSIILENYSFYSGQAYSAYHSIYDYSLYRGLISRRIHSNTKT